MSTPFSWDLFKRMPLIGIMRNLPGEYIELIAEKYLGAGLTCLEVTMNSPNAEKHIAALTKSFAGKLNIGAGTVCSMHDLENALNAGAAYIVTPIINEEVIKACVKQHIPIFPGAFTPTEIYKASDLGADMIKIFPAGILRPGYIKEILAPLTGVKLIPTGGITLDNFTAYLAAGAQGVGIGSHIFQKETIKQADWDALSGIFAQFVTAYNAYNLK
jgi:2-dehydro-3-deoxyphosphogluconate aldolase/(4S)-4-hydroxy-2-oxoglutarate aldolase